MLLEQINTYASGGLGAFVRPGVGLGRTRLSLTSLTTALTSLTSLTSGFTSFTAAGTSGLPIRLRIGASDLGENWFASAKRLSKDSIVFYGILFSFHRI